MPITSIKPDHGGGEANAHTVLEAHWCADSVSGPGSQTDASNGQVESSRGQMDAPNALNGAETAVVSCSDGPRTYLPGLEVQEDIQTCQTALEVTWMRQVGTGR